MEISQTNILVSAHSQFVLSNHFQINHTVIKFVPNILP